MDIPVTEEALVRAILKRDTIIQANIAAKDWVQLHCPAADSKALVAALALRTTERSTSDRVRMKKVVGMVNRSTLALDYAGDIEDAARVHRAYAEYAEAMGLLRSLYPTLTP